MVTKRDNNLAAWITGGCVVLAAVISVIGKSCQSDPVRSSMKANKPPALSTAQVAGNYNHQEANNSPGAIQIAGDFNNYYPLPEIESRPYLTIELKPGANEYLRKDGNSQLFLICCHNNFYLVLPFKIRNVGKIHVKSIQASYTGSDQNSVTFDLGEKSHFLASGEEILGPFRPWIDISSIVNNEDSEEFKIELVLAYQKYNEEKLRTYNSKLALVLTKEEIAGYSKAYKIQNGNLTFEK